LLRTGGGHAIRKALFRRGIQDGFVNVDEVEELLPDGLMTVAERWLLYFSLRASEVQLRDSTGRAMTPDDAVPEHHRPRVHRHQVAMETEDARAPALDDQLR
jgi:hypothetical protein